MDKPKTLQEAVVYFSDPQRAFEYAVKLRWPDGNVVCPRCGKAKHSFIKTRRIWFCYECKKQFSLKVGTIFEDSPLGLDKWMIAFWLLSNNKNGISSYELGKALGIHQNSAWFMLQRIRLVMQDSFFGSKLGGGEGAEIEVDESFIGGKARNMHVSERKRRITGTGTKDKTAVMGILERGGKIRTTVVPNRKKTALQGEVRKHVTAGAALYSDALLSYDGLATDYAHKVVDHAVQYMDGRVHTNGLENFWSLLKRGISGTYVSVEPYHLFRYLDEQSFRYNTRKDMNDSQRFELAMSQVFGKRLTYDQLTGKSDAPHHETTGTRETTTPF
ncbi:MAG TPA: IS1595 family transposase [Candidatus Sulfotelmatobacter sp.]